MCGVCIAGVAATYTCLWRPERVLKILKGMSAQSKALKFEQTPEHAKLKKRVWIRATSAFTFMGFLSVYEPFVWPDYFLLLDLVARLWWSIVIALLEMQVVCYTDAFINLFKTLNNQLESGRSASVEALRIVHDELCDLLSLFQVFGCYNLLHRVLDDWFQFQEHYGLFVLANVIYLFDTLTFGTYFSLVGIFQNLPDVEKIIKQAVVSDAWLIYASYRSAKLVGNCCGSLKEVKIICF